jgi:hypothetical protein
LFLILFSNIASLTLLVPAAPVFCAEESCGIVAATYCGPCNAHFCDVRLLLPQVYSRFNLFPPFYLAYTQGHDSIVHLAGASKLHARSPLKPVPVPQSSNLSPTMPVQCSAVCKLLTTYSSISARCFVVCKSIIVLLFVILRRLCSLGWLLVHN